MNELTSINWEGLIELKEQYDHAKLTGMKGQVERIRLLALQKTLEPQKMRVMRYTPNWLIWWLDEDGEFIRDNELGRTRCESLKDYEGNIPSDIIKRIPPGVVSRAKVITPDSRIDPIIAIRINYWKDLWIAIFRWE